ncbi:zeta toxin family protein [Kribbella kalugense]|uniref:zeta toxin family protein n=1 Tax=Kribbella kalugense TaxID=2512221 RepID=UPI001416FE59|nr:zeta toxin family protein [Kribbella kalugense]
MNEQYSTDEYVLDETESQRIFHDHIVPDQLTASRQDNPVVVFVGGQPGDGKASVSALARSVLDRRGGVVTLCADQYEPYHPAFHELVGSNDLRAEQCVGFDGRRWLAEAELLTIEERYDAVVETNLADPLELDVSARRFKARGYRVEVALVAAHASISRFGRLDRHLRALQAYGYARMAEMCVHEACYEGVLEAADMLDQDGPADVVAVVRPNGQTVYRNRRTDDGRWQHSPATADAVRSERARIWTLAESKQFLGDVRDYELRGLGAPDRWIREEAINGAIAVVDLARPQLDPIAVTFRIATAGTTAPRLRPPGGVPRPGVPR